VGKRAITFSVPEKIWKNKSGTLSGSKITLQPTGRNQNDP
jgi:hypothetical protein